MIHLGILFHTRSPGRFPNEVAEVLMPCRAGNLLALMRRRARSRRHSYFISACTALNPKSGYENYGKNSQSVSSVSQPLVAVPRGVLGRFIVRGDAPFRFSNQVRHSAIAVT